MLKVNGAKPMGVELNQAPHEKQQWRVIKILNALLADESVLYTKLRNYHWNVTDVDFYALFVVFDSQLNEICAVIDEVAERIRQYGSNVPGTMEEFIRQAHLSEAPGIYPDAQTMITNLVNDHGAIIGFLCEDIEVLGEKSKDVGIVDLLTYLLQRHQKMAWMPRTCINERITARATGTFINNTISG
ncbi:DNA protection during starvation protein 1 [Candidatus Brocadiaceae bacterium]|nr:DNA protection during starvation protein 1 [Candidatus Brocadiaceae bacterium]